MTDDEFINYLRLRRLQKMPESEMPKIEIKNALEGWVSPIELIYREAETEFVKHTEEGIMAKIESTLEVKVDRDELIKAMHYDREQYRKGCENGYKKRDAEIVRCKDCKWYDGTPYCIETDFDQCEPDAYCSKGKRK